MHGEAGAGVAEAAGNNTAFWKPLWSGMKQVLTKVQVRKKDRALSLQETLPLGERRFLAVVRWENETLLVGVTPQAITLLEPRAAKEARGLSGKEESEG